MCGAANGLGEPGPRRRGVPDVTASPDDRLDDLFVRYWDNALTPAELAELAERLRADPAERDRFRLLCLHAVAAGEQTAVARTAVGPPPPATLGGPSRAACPEILGAGWRPGSPRASPGGGCGPRAGPAWSGWRPPAGW